jgi:hypothetical protein
MTFETQRGRAATKNIHCKIRKDAKEKQKIEPRRTRSSQGRGEEQKMGA